MNHSDNLPERGDQATRRAFLWRIGREAAGGLALALAASGRPETAPAAALPPFAGVVRKRTLGKTGLKVSEIGFGGHSWAYARVPDGRGGLRKASLEEAFRMISLGLEMGVNFFDSCTAEDEHTVPGEVIKRLGKRDQIVVSARMCHKMKGVPNDRTIIGKWVEERLKLWQTDYFDLLMLTNEARVTPQSGYWDMSYCLEAVAELKKQGKIRFAGFGCHFTAEGFRDAFQKYGHAWDVCSIPYNVRHRMAESLFPEAEKAGLGIVTIKPLARGELLAQRDLAGAESGLARDMIAWVLENEFVDCCLCGVHTEAQVRENFSASWTRLTPAARRRLDQVAARTPSRHLAWLEQGWLC